GERALPGACRPAPCQEASGDDGSVRLGDRASGDRPPHAPAVEVASGCAVRGLGKSAQPGATDAPSGRRLPQLLGDWRPAPKKSHPCEAATTPQSSPATISACEQSHLEEPPSVINETEPHEASPAFPASSFSRQGLSHARGWCGCPRRGRVQVLWPLPRRARPSCGSCGCLLSV